MPGDMSETSQATLPTPVEVVSLISFTSLKRVLYTRMVISPVWLVLNAKFTRVVAGFGNVATSVSRLLKLAETSGVVVEVTVGVAVAVVIGVWVKVAVAAGVGVMVTVGLNVNVGVAVGTASR